MNAAAPAARQSLEAPLSLAGRAALALEILLAYARVRWWLRRSDFRSTLRALRARRVSPGANTAGPVRLGRAVMRTLRLLPTDSRCLMQSLVLTALLARRGIPSTLVIGVTPAPEFGAHAWVESGGLALLPPRDRIYERLAEL